MKPNFGTRDIFRFRENIQGNFKVSKSTLIEGDESLRLSLNSKYIRIGVGDSGGPVFDKDGFIIGLASYGNRDFGNTQRQYADNAIEQVEGAEPILGEVMKDLSFILCLKAGMKISGYFPAYYRDLMVNYILSYRYASDDEAQLFMRSYFGPHAARSVMDEVNMHSKLAAFEASIVDKDNEIIERLFGEEDNVFSGSHFCIHANVKEWIDEVILAHGK